MENNLIISEYSQEIFDVSIIIVNWNAGHYLKETIESVFEKTHDISYEIIVIDNNSRKDDESYLYLKNTLQNNLNTTILFSEENLGFAKANNYGMRIAKGKSFLILNPDVLLHNNDIKILFDYLNENPSAGMVGPKVLSPDGSFQQPCLRGKPYPMDTMFHLIGLAKAFPQCEWLNGYALWHLNRDEINECWAIMGCCMLVSRKMYEEIGGMEEDFFMYQEETDWGIRARNAGYKVIYNPQAEITHYKGVTTDAIKIKSAFYFTQSMEKFFKKYFWSKYNFIQKGFWLVLIWGNFGLKCVKSMGKRRK